MKPAAGPFDELGVKFVLFAEGKVHFLKRLFPDEAETFFDLEAALDALREGATEAQAEIILAIRGNGKACILGRGRAGNFEAVSHAQETELRAFLVKKLGGKVIHVLLPDYSQAQFLQTKRSREGRAKKLRAQRALEAERNYPAALKNANRIRGQ